MGLFSLYDSWSTADTKSIGQTYFAKCKTNDGYEHKLEIGKNYIIKIVEPILPMSPLCHFYSDGKQVGTCHLTRFEKLRELKK